MSFPRSSDVGKQFVAVLGSASISALPIAAAAQANVEVDFSAFSSSNAFLLADDDVTTLGGEVVVRSDGTIPIDYRTSIDANGRIGFRQYDRRFGNFWTGRGAATLQHRRNEYLSLQTDAYYERQLPTEALTESVDAAVDPVSIRENIGAGQSLIWHPDALTTITGRVSWATSRPERPSPVLDSTAFNFTASAERRLSPHFSVGAEAQYTIGKTTLEQDSSVKSFRLTASRRSGDGWRAQVGAGIEQATEPSLPGEQEDGPLRFNGSVLVCLEPRRTTLCISASKASRVSGLGLQRESSAEMLLEHRLSESGMLNFTAAFRRASLSDGDLTATVVDVDLEYRHRLDRQFSVFAGTGYQRRDQLGGTEVAAVGARIGLTFRGGAQ